MVTRWVFLALWQAWGLRGNVKNLYYLYPTLEYKLSKWYTPLTASAQAAFANIVPAAQSMEVQRSVSDLPGGFAQKKLGQKVYCYYQFKSLDGKTRQIYLGKDSDSLRQLMDKFKAMTPNTAAAAHLARLCRSAIELGAESVGRTHFRILQRLADHGFFHAGGILIGTHAFLAYQNHFGIRWTEGNQTLDIDFAHPGNNLSIALPDGLQMDARSAIDSLEMGFIPNVSQTTFIKQDEPDLQLDFVTPKVSTSDAPIRVHALNLSMQPLRFMDFSMDTSMQAVLISRNGPVVVTVPRAERYALHKLIVFGERPADMQAKAQKDLAQAACLISYLNDNEPDALADAWAQVQTSGNGWVRRCEQGAQRLHSRYSDVDLGFMTR